MHNMERKNTTEQLQKALIEAAKQFPRKKGIQRFELMLERWEAEGKLLKSEYSFPPIDTIGRRMYADLRTQWERD